MGCLYGMEAGLYLESDLTTKKIELDKLEVKETDSNSYKFKEIIKVSDIGNLNTYDIEEKNIILVIKEENQKFRVRLDKDEIADENENDDDVFIFEKIENIGSKSYFIGTDDYYTDYYEDFTGYLFHLFTDKEIKWKASDRKYLLSVECDNCESTDKKGMTVKELKEELQKFDDNDRVYLIGETKYWG